MSNYIDARTYDGSTDLEADICIAGAGAAGITLARELSGAKFDVVVLESGGFSLEGDTQFLYHGTNSGIRYFDLTAARLRYFGGTTNHWGGFCGFNSELDYAGRPAIGLPSWPINHKDLEIYLRRAAISLGINFDEFDAAKSLASAGFDPVLMLDRATNAFYTRSHPWSPKRRLAEVFKETIGSAENLRVFLNLNLTHVQMTDDGSRVDHFVAKTLTGKTVMVRSKVFILACHAIENARMLLLSNDVHKAGIGNSSDQVGRNFMEHIRIYKGSFIANTQVFPQFYWEKYGRMGPPYVPNVKLGLSARAVRENDMMRYSCAFRPVYDNESIFESVKALSNSFFEPFRMRMAKDFKKVINNLPEAINVTKDHFGIQVSKPVYFRMRQGIGQAPNPNSRVTLTDKKDALGLPKVNLHWAVTELDLHSFNRGQEIIVRELSAMGLGRFVVTPFTKDEVNEKLLGSWHHMGTTKMSDSRRSGVVDANCRVHGAPNLYVAGSSVFPTSSSSGPTMMIIAMAMRLSDHIKQKVLT